MCLSKQKSKHSLQSVTYDFEGLIFFIFMDKENTPQEFMKTKQYKQYYEPRLKEIESRVKDKEKFNSKSFFQKLIIVDLWIKKGYLK